MSSVIVAGSRTPIGRFNGALAAVSAAELGGVAIRGAIERAGLTGSDVEYVIMGEVLQAGVGQIPARQAAVKAGIPMDVPAITVNKVCLSGLDAIALADQLIRAGQFKVIVAGGMESMTRAPHLLMGSRAGFKYGDVTMVDHLAHDGLHDVFTAVPMGELTETTNDLDYVSRAEQDAFSARSHQRAAAATAAGVFKAEIEPVVVKGRKGDVVVDTDEGIRAETTVETLAKLRPSFRKDGTITAGSSSQISDGAAAVIVMDKDEALRRGLDWIAEIKAHGSIAGPDSTLQDKPARAIKKACDKAGITPDELDLVEINEAFACVGIASARALGLDEEIVNVNGGAIALGHPIGASGARLVLHTALELQRRGGGLGVATLCGGGGQGDALLVEVPRSS
ncbi:acetyl-CoA C-acetyltransferase [Nakamurella multipartita]|uniref:Probable acetyl-CoA acetyltransferase n=1 Tax=Nakamurella multipartita (strain ATCC 700099 / DSM 44233 / CIP 104796 / JCM 9543 / NBRC 105858 / Y-104) TaxID=479431 RepID=C8XJB0_NAKMY|nr:acetyl-CoA C-acetyltransferase [Nakamurella multipartita]ACV78575.1 acetyl-CoA acetyltransferase [Nakamurella multipartita DSM 44233]